MQIIFWIAVILLALNVFLQFLAAGIIYTVLLVRTSKKKWGREVKLPEGDDEYRDMYYEGLD